MLRVGAEIALKPRCAVPMLPHGALPARPAALRVPTRLNRVEIPGLGELPCVGVYAKVVAGGRVALGDFVRFEPACRVQPCLQDIEIKHKINVDTGRS